MNMKELEEGLKAAMTLIATHERNIEAMRGELSDALIALQVMSDAQRTSDAQIIELQDQVGGKNRSAATKRNMTDADALRVLDGDVKEMGHKEAAATVGLTYAQVYSARLAFTFKHVHRTLEKGGWKSKWSKG